MFIMATDATTGEEAVREIVAQEMKGNIYMEDIVVRGIWFDKYEQQTAMVRRPLYYCESAEPK